jgi:hypothetical protein
MGGYQAPGPARMLTLDAGLVEPASTIRHDRRAWLIRRLGARWVATTQPRTVVAHRPHRKVVRRWRPRTSDVVEGQRPALPRKFSRGSSGRAVRPLKGELSVLQPLCARSRYPAREASQRKVLVRRSVPWAGGPRSTPHPKWLSVLPASPAVRRGGPSSISAG